METILALDISSSSTGVCVFKNGKILYCDTIKLKAKFHAHKLYIFENVLRAIFIKFKPAHVAIEDCWQGSNRKTFKILSLYHGVAYKLCYEMTASDPFLLMPSEVRKVIGGVAGENLVPSRKNSVEGDSKRLTFNLIQKVFNLDDYTFEKNNDNTDAIAVAVACCLVNGDDKTRSLFDAGGKSRRKRRPNKKSVS